MLTYLYRVLVDGIVEVPQNDMEGHSTDEPNKNMHVWLNISYCA